MLGAEGSNFDAEVSSQVSTNFVAFVWKDGIFEGGFFFLIILKLLYLL